MNPDFLTRLRALCKRVNVQLRMDSAGNPSGLREPLFRALLKAQPEFQSGWRRKGRPKDTAKIDDLAVLKSIDAWAEQHPYLKRAIIKKAVIDAASEQWGYDLNKSPEATEKRLRRARRVLDKLQNSAAAKKTDV